MKKSTSKKGIKFKKGEKLIIAVLSLLALMTPIMVVYTSATLSSSNIEVEKMKKKIENKKTLIQVYQCKLMNLQVYPLFKMLQRVMV